MNSRSSFSTLFLVGLVAMVFCQSPAPTPGPSPPPAPVQPERQCDTPGNICVTCDTVALCVGNGDGSFVTLRQSCQPDERCVGGQCIKGALCNYREFRCSGEGYYPDPYDCSVYHICLPSPADGSLSDNLIPCPENQAYNASSEDCSASRQSVICTDRPVPECLSRLQIGPIPGDNSLYYVCIEDGETIAPELRRCPAGRIFNSSSVSCVDSSPSSSDKKGKKKKTKS